MLVIAVGLTSTAFAQRTVTLRLNTATLPDTLDALDEVQIRGAVDDVGPFTLPDGNVIDWSDFTTLKPANVGGDYWDLTFQIPDNSKLNFKAYAQLAEDDQIGGWEDGDNAQIDAGTGDVDLGLHYYIKGDGQAYDWSPFEQKPDSIGVMFRVWANTTDGVTAGFVGDGTDALAVRGDPIDGVSPLTWGADTGVTLQQENTDSDATPGWSLFSGMAYYPVSAAGTPQAYKFVAGPEGWESSADRFFDIPSEDSTLHWVYFGNSPPVTGQGPVESDIEFSVDLSMLEIIGIFRRARGDTLQVRGSFNGWGCSNPDICLLEKQFGSAEFAQFVTLNLIPGVDIEYKYFIDFEVQAVKDEFGVDVIPSGWEEPIGTQGANRKEVYTGEGQTFIDTYNQLLIENMILVGNEINMSFSVDMTPALTAADPFNPATDTVSLGFHDPIWSMTQGLALTPRSDNPDLGDALNLGEFASNFWLEDPDGDMVYTGAFRVQGPTYSGVQYKYIYGSPSGNTFSEENGGNTSGPGRRRTRFIVPFADGTWPRDHAFPPETYQADGDLPFEPNPAVPVSVEDQGGELPTTIHLSQNFPNPFNPVTTFEYTIDTRTQIKLSIYDVLGRRVATLVDAIQPASSYRVTFDASRLASGTYMYRLETPSKVITRSMVLLK